MATIKVDIDRLENLAAMAGLTTDAARLYRAREQQLSRGFEGAGTGGS